MKTLRVVQGGVENGDMQWLLKAAPLKLDSRRWILPKAAEPGDEVVIYVQGHGFFALATVVTHPTPRRGWFRRYAGRVTQISLIKPPISLGVIRDRIPALSWARYPRSITTPSLAVAKHIRELIAGRRKLGVSELREVDLSTTNLEELRAVALRHSRERLSPREARTLYRLRSSAIRRYVLARALGYCEGCMEKAPFATPDGKPYLEPHHTTRVADNGPDHPAHVIALCPNCHRRAHYSEDSRLFTRALKRKLTKLEAPATR